jgi:hypothetical protein
LPEPTPVHVARQSVRNTECREESGRPGEQLGFAHGSDKYIAGGYCARLRSTTA